MKRLFTVLLCAILVVSPLFQTLSFAQSVSELMTQYGHEIDPEYLPKGGVIVVDASTGAVLFSENDRVDWPPASLTKMMVVYLAYQAMERGEFTEETEVTVTEDVAYLSTDTELSNNHMPLGSVFTISELLDLTIIPSSASAVLLLANQLGPHEKVVHLMNQTARELGMTKTSYVNVVGARNDDLTPYLDGLKPGQDNQTNAYDQAIFATHLVREYPEVLAHTVNQTFLLKPGTEFEEWFESRNLSLPGAGYAYDGMDGLKTGSTDEAAFNISLTAKQGDTRLVAIVLGTGVWDNWESEAYRSIIGNVLMDYTFTNFSTQTILSAGEHEIEGQTITTQEDLSDIASNTLAPSFVMAGDRLIQNTDRVYLPGFEAPSVAYQVVTPPTEEEPEEIITADVPGDEPTDPIMQKNIRQSLFTLTLYLIGLLLLLLILRSSILRAIRKRINRDKRKWRR